MSYLLDTNVISEIVKPRPNATVLKWVEALDTDRLYLSVITLGEIRKGVAGISDLNRQKKIIQWLETELPNYFEDRILSIDRKVANMWGRLQSETKGRVLPAIDALLAATARVHNLTLVTRNVKDFIHTSINVIDPWK
jgi:hypothetical protein